MILQLVTAVVAQREVILAITTVQTATLSQMVSKRSRTLHSEPSEVNTSLYPEVVPVHSTPTKPGINRADANKLLESPISKCDKEAKKVSESAEVFIRVK